MAAGSTYTPIATTTFSGSSSSYTFTSIPSTYTDLKLIISFSGVSSCNFSTRVGNGSIDSASNYGYTRLYGTGSGGGSTTNASNDTFLTANITAGASGSNSTIDILNYSNNTTQKTAFHRFNDGTSIVFIIVGEWRSTAAINQIQIFSTNSVNFAAGTVATIFGIKAA